MANPFAHLLPPESPAPAPAPATPANQLISEASTLRADGPGSGSGAGGFTIYEDRPGDYQSKETPEVVRRTQKERKEKKARAKAGKKAEKKREATRKGEREEEMKSTGKMMRGGY